MTRFLRRLRKAKKTGSITGSVQPSEDAQRAYEQSQANLRATGCAWPEVLDLVDSLRAVREENNFETRIRATLTGGSP